MSKNLHQRNYTVTKHYLGIFANELNTSLLISPQQDKLLKSIKHAQLSPPLLKCKIFFEQPSDLIYIQFINLKKLNVNLLERNRNQRRLVLFFLGGIWCFAFLLRSRQVSPIFLSGQISGKESFLAVGTNPFFLRKRPFAVEKNGKKQEYQTCFFCAQEKSILFFSLGDKQEPYVPPWKSKNQFPLQDQKVQ